VVEHAVHLVTIKAARWRLRGERGVEDGASTGDGAAVRFKGAASMHPNGTHGGRCARVVESVTVTMSSI